MYIFEVPCLIHELLKTEEKIKQNVIGSKM